MERSCGIGLHDRLRRAEEGIEQLAPRAPVGRILYRLGSPHARPGTDLATPIHRGNDGPDLVIVVCSPTGRKLQ